MYPADWHINLGQVVQKLVNANPELKVHPLLILLVKKKNEYLSLLMFWVV